MYNDFDFNQLIIRRNKRSKNLRLSVDLKGKPILSIPFFCPKWYALNWAKKHKNWIQNHIFVPTIFSPEQMVSICGKNYILKHDPTQKLNTIIGSKIIIGGDLSFFNRRICDLVKKEFLSLLKEQIPIYAKNLGVKFKRITLRDTSSRWGSCSSSGNLSFCWRIALAPDFVIHYLIAHEVSHLKYMNHSHYFWTTVATLTQDTLRAKNWLKHHAKELQIG